MTHTISFKINRLPQYEVEDFLESWNQIGHYTLLKKGVYKLVGNDNEKSILSIQATEIKIDGSIPATAAKIIEDFSAVCAETITQKISPEYTEVLEGEVIDKNDRSNGPNFNSSFNSKFNGNFQAQFQRFQWKNLPWQSKLKVTVFMVIAIPLLVILIPIALVFILIRIVLFSFFRR